MPDMPLPEVVHVGEGDDTQALCELLRLNPHVTTMFAELNAWEKERPGRLGLIVLVDAEDDGTLFFQCTHVGIACLHQGVQLAYAAAMRAPKCEGE